MFPWVSQAAIQNYIVWIYQVIVAVKGIYESGGKDMSSISHSPNYLKFLKQK